MQVLSGDDEGAIAIVVALFALVLFGFAALVVDVGNASDVRAQASDAADTGALAGARDLAAWTRSNGMVPDPRLDAAVKDAVNASFPVSDAEWAACSDASIPPGLTALPTTECIQYSATTTESTVRVRIPARKVPSTFGGIFGVGSISVSPVAAAAAGQPALAPCEPCNPPLQGDGKPSAPVTYTLPAGADSPSTPGTVDPVTDCPLTPGYFDFDVTTRDNCASPAPGVYVFEDHDLEVAAPFTFVATDATLLFTGTGTLSVEGTIDLAAPTDAAAVTKGVAVVLEGQATRRFDLGDSFHIVGDVYALAGTTWQVDANDCMPVNGTCDLDGDLAVSDTDFPSSPPRVPTVKRIPPPALPSPQPEHLTE